MTLKTTSNLGAPTASMDDKSSQPPSHSPGMFHSHGSLVVLEDSPSSGGPYMPVADVCALLGRMLYTVTMEKIRIYEMSINTDLFIRARPEDVGGEEQLARVSQLVEWLFSKWAFYDGGKTKFESGKLIKFGLENFAGVRMMFFMIGFRKIGDAKQTPVKSEHAKEASCTSESAKEESGKDVQTQHEEQTESTDTHSGRVTMDLPFRSKG